MLKKLLYTLLLSLCSATQVVYAQTSLKKYVRENAVCLKAENALLINDTDFQFLDTIAKSHRIILLGESTHCDSITPIIKAKMVEYLYKKHGFDVLCFESDFFSITEAWRKLHNHSEIERSFIDSSLAPLIIGPNVSKIVFADLLPLIRKDSIGLQLAGIDNQLSALNSKQNFSLSIKEFVRQNFDDTLDLSFLDTLVQTDLYSYRESDTIVLKYLINSTNELTKVLSKYERFNKSYERTYLINLATLCAQNLAGIPSPFSTEQMRIRDLQMADNYKWLLDNLYPNKKVIVWAHNLHIMYNTSNLFPRFKSLGEIIKQKDSLDELYSIGFTARNNYTCGWPLFKENYLYLTRNRKRLELYFPLKEFYFIDTRKYNLLRANPTQFRSSLEFQGLIHEWFRGFDGIFYIKTLHPTTF